jgi:hypothetical protein
MASQQPSVVTFGTAQKGQDLRLVMKVQNQNGSAEAAYTLVDGNSSADASSAPLKPIHSDQSSAVYQISRTALATIAGNLYHLALGVRPYSNGGGAVDLYLECDQAGAPLTAYSNGAQLPATNGTVKAASAYDDGDNELVAISIVLQ